MSALGAARWRLGQALDRLAYSGRLPEPLARRRVARFWEDYAPRIDAEWGTDDSDHAVLAELIRRYDVRSVLDLGCGSGRHFGLYASAGISEVLGLDISAEALALAARRFPAVPTRRLRLEDLPADLGHWDLAVSNRVLQHVAPTAINRVVARICDLGQYVYINELSHTDALTEEFFMTRHDYRPCFAAAGFHHVEEGRLGDQTWQLYGKPAAVRP